jgi:hypothetical protein
MTRSRFAPLLPAAVVVAIATVLTPTLARAHNAYRLIGTLTKVGPKRIELKQTKDGRTILVDISDKTTVTRDKKTITAADLKAGQSVVVDATGDSLQFLVATAIRVVPAPPAAGAK